MKKIVKKVLVFQVRGFGTAASPEIMKIIDLLYTAGCKVIGDISMSMRTIEAFQDRSKEADLILFDCLYEAGSNWPLEQIAAGVSVAQDVFKSKKPFLFSQNKNPAGPTEAIFGYSLPIEVPGSEVYVYANVEDLFGKLKEKLGV